jgi:hypothetical protein
MGTETVTLQPELLYAVNPILESVSLLHMIFERSAIIGIT